MTPLRQSIASIRNKSVKGKLNSACRPTCGVIGAISAFTLTPGDHR
jgi:hypothetical protein